MMPEDYIQNHIEIETPHLRETAMTRYEQCWDALMWQMYNGLPLRYYIRTGR